MLEHHKISLKFKVNYYQCKYFSKNANHTLTVVGGPFSPLGYD